MRAAFLADLHSHTWKQYARVGAGGVNTRLLDLKSVLSQTWTIMKAKKLVDCYVAGDLFHVKRHVPVQAEVVLYEEFAEAKRQGLKVHIISGNHDQVEDDGYANTPRIFGHVAEVYAEPGLDKDRRIAYVPWQFDQDRVRKFLKDLRGEWNLLLYHGEVRGAFVGPTDYPIALKSQVTRDDLQPAKFDWIMMGHLHRRQMVAERMYYAGNPLPKDRGEPETDKGVAIVEYDHIDVAVTQHPRFVTLDLTNGPTVKDAFAKTKGNFLYLIVPASTDSKTLERMLEHMQPREVEVHRAPRAKDQESARKTNVRLGQTLEEMFDHYVDEEGEGDPAKKAFCRGLLEDVEKEGASH